MRCIILLLLLVLPPALMAQDQDGTDTPGNWRVRHHEIFGIWNSMCDEREEHSVLVQRCYIRHVDVFSPQPMFAAQFMFLTPAPMPDDPGGVSIEFGFELGTLFETNGFRIEQNGQEVWRTQHPGCLAALRCRFEGPTALGLLSALLGGGTFHFDFVDRHGTPQRLIWPLAGFDQAHQDFQTQSKQRGLRP